ncbi:branched-chain amino acid ABC transporter substrate-binding protein [bacterium]|nr:MAG: branched-chain amino acid ABC transporter substrate-binding protein [bacterium]
MNIKTALGWAPAAALAIGALVTGACGAPGGQSGNASGPIVIGGLTQTTGVDAYVGAQCKDAMQLAVDQANAAGGINGRQIQLTFEDDQDDPAKAATLTQKMINEGVAAVVEHDSSAITLAVLPIANRARVVVMSVSATSPSVTERGYHYFFRTINRADRGQPVIEADYAVEALHATSAAVLNDKTTYGQSFTDAFAAEFAAKGGKIIATDSITAGAADYTPILTRIKSNAPDVLVYGGYYPEAGLIAKQMKQLDMSTAFMSAALLGTNYTEIAGPGAVGTINGGAPDPKWFPPAKKFFDAFSNRYHQNPTEWAAHAYDATNILIAALRKSGSDNKQALRNAVAGVSNYPGTYGPISFDAKGDITTNGNVIFVFRGGQDWAAYGRANGKWSLIRE